MSDEERKQLMIQQVRRNERPFNQCVFGCTDNELNPQGYCHHLHGFTIDNKTMEVQEPWPGREGYLQTGIHTEPVLRTDIVVPQGTPTSRVYRGGPGERPVANAGDAAVQRTSDDVATLLEMVGELQAKVAAMEGGQAQPLESDPE